MENELMVSIKCAAYNHEPYIRQCLEGFVMQKTNFRFEAIVHDDASTDRTAAIIKEYADKYPDIIKPVFETENQYQKNNLTAVMDSYMHGKYIAICEGDDYWTDPYKLQKQVDFLEQHPDYILSYSDKIVVDEYNKKLITNKLYCKNEYLFDYLIFIGNPITTATTCFRRNAYFQAKDKMNEIKLKNLRMGDYPVWIIMSTLGKFRYEKDIMAAYRILQNSASHSSDYKRIDSFFKDELRIKNELYTEYMGENKFHIFEKAYYKTIIRKMVQYDNEIFLKYFKEGIKHYPQLIFSPKLLFFLFAKLIGLLKVLKN